MPHRAGFLSGLISGVVLCAAGGGVLALLGYRVVDAETLAERPGGDVSSDPGGPVTPAARKQALAALQKGNDAVVAGDWDVAVAEGERTLKLDPSVAEAHKLLGLALWRRAQPCDGRRHFLRYLELEPGDEMNARIQVILEKDEMQACVGDQP